MVSMYQCKIENLDLIVFNLNCKSNLSTSGLNTRKIVIAGATGASNLYGHLYLIPHTNPPSVSFYPFAHFHLIGPGL